MIELLVIYSIVKVLLTFMPITGFKRVKRIGDSWSGGTIVSALTSQSWSGGTTISSMSSQSWTGGTII